MDPARHLRLSIALVAVFTATGLWLEAMYGLRSEGWMQDELRREFVRLGHAHGGLLGILNIAVAWALGALSTPEPWAQRIRLAMLVGAAMVPVGFIGGGLWHGPTDPGPLVLLAPAGAMLLVASLVATALVRPSDAR